MEQSQEKHDLDMKNKEEQNKATVAAKRAAAKKPPSKSGDK
jgi:hypothetical protein